MIDLGILAELIPWLLGTLGVVLGAWAYTSKKTADTRLEQAHTDKHRVEIELEEVRGEQSRFDQMMQLVNAQLQINQTFSTALQQVALVDEQNYQVAKRIWDRQSQEIIGETRRSRKLLLERMDDLPERLAAVQVEGLRTLLQEMATQMANIARENKSDRTPFPGVRDARWIEAYIEPRNGLACLFDEPRLSEPARTVIEEACVRGQERAWVICEAVTGFHAVRRSNGTYGWLLASAIKVDDLADTLPGKITKENKGEESSSSGNSDSDARAGAGDAGPGGAGAAGRGGDSAVADDRDRDRGGGVSGRGAAADGPGGGGAEGEQSARDGGPGDEGAG